jgi:PEP-CTERM motif
VRKLIGRLVVAAIAVWGVGAQAGIIFNNWDGVGIGSEDRPEGQAYLTFIEVGAENVAISGLGVFGDLALTANARAAVYEGPESLPALNVEFLSPLFLSESMSVSASNQSWFDVTGFSYTLLADTNYYIGVFFDQIFTVAYDAANLNTTAVTQSGLSWYPTDLLPVAATAPPGLNGGAGEINLPYARSSGNVVISSRIYSGIPTPATLALFGIGLAGLGWSRRKKV